MEDRTENDSWLSDAPKVSCRAVAEKYLRDESVRLFGQGIASFDFVRLKDQDLWQLLEALSFTFRRNSMFYYITDSQAVWRAGTVPIERIVLTGMSRTMTKLIFSPMIDRKPQLLVQHLQKYFDAHPHDDPDNYGDCRFRTVKASETVLYGRLDDGVVKMLDGSHRLLSLISQGATEVAMYVHQSSQDTDPKPAAGVTLLALRHLFETAHDNDTRQAILKVTQQIVASTSDGTDVINEYWLGYGAKPEVVHAGKQIINDQSVPLISMHKTYSPPKTK